MNVRKKSVLLVVVLGVITFITVSCSQPLTEGQNPGECENGADDDEDGLFDCADPDCVPAPACAGDDDDTAVTDDDDTFNDDDDTAHGDDDTDHGDDDSAGPGDDDDSSGPGPGDDDDTANPGENQNVGDCSDGIDNDGDELVDCADPDCGNDSPECLGDDDDSASGGDDDDSTPGGENCSNQIDDDNDSFVDCDDPDCDSTPACQGPLPEVCNNNIDDDQDSYIDCLDDDCIGNPNCTSGSTFPGSEVGSQTGCPIGAVASTCVMPVGNPIQGSQSEIVPGDINGLAITVTTSHGAVGDLTLTVSNPGGGGTVTLVSAGVVSGDFTDTVFCDSMTCSNSPAISTGSPPYTGDYNPEQSLSGFNGFNVNGDWTLTVTNAGSTTGTLDWSIGAVLQ